LFYLPVPRNLFYCGSYLEKELANLNADEPGKHDDEEKPNEGEYSYKELIEAEITEYCTEVRNCDADWNTKVAQMSQLIYHEPTVTIKSIIYYTKHIIYICKNTYQLKTVCKDDVMISVL